MKDIKLKFIDVLDSPKKKRYFKLMRKYMLEAFPGESAYIKVMRKILRRKLFYPNEIFRLLLALKNDHVIGGAVYRYWMDLKVGVLEYLFVASKLRGQGIGTLLYKKMREDLRRMKSRGLFFSVKGTKNMDKCFKKNGEPVYPETEQISRIRRYRFYKKLGALPLKGVSYSTPAYWRLDFPYTNPLFFYDPLKRKRRIRVSSNLVKKVIKRIMKQYYEVELSHYRVRKILSSIRGKELTVEDVE
ncbi:MAG: GNAT family N-acetyltransferase [Candidatus Asgardarchaeia archaeon]